MDLKDIYGLIKFWLLDSNPQANFALENIQPIEGDFSIDKELIAQSKKTGLKRFPENPKNWGPMARHKAN